MPQYLPVQHPIRIHLYPPSIIHPPPIIHPSALTDRPTTHPNHPPDPSVLSFQTFSFSHLSFLLFRKWFHTTSSTMSSALSKYCQQLRDNNITRIV
jgi:hypothetical protein